MTSSELFVEHEETKASGHSCTMRSRLSIALAVAAALVLLASLAASQVSVQRFGHSLVPLTGGAVGLLLLSSPSAFASPSPRSRCASG